MPLNARPSRSRARSPSRSPRRPSPTVLTHTREMDGVGTDEPTPPPAPVAWPYDEPPQRPLAAPTPIWKRITGPVVAVAVALAKWGALLLKLKVFTFAAGMLFSIGAYAWLWGWKFAVGFVAMMLV